MFVFLLIRMPYTESSQRITCSDTFVNDFCAFVKGAFQMVAKEKDCLRGSSLRSE